MYQLLPHHCIKTKNGLIALLHIANIQNKTLAYVIKTLKDELQEDINAKSNVAPVPSDLALLSEMYFKSVHSNKLIDGLNKSLGHLALYIPFTQHEDTLTAILGEYNKSINDILLSLGCSMRQVSVNDIEQSDTKANYNLTVRHPKNECEVRLQYSDNYQLVSAEYLDGEEVLLTDRVARDFQGELDFIGSRL